VRWSTYVRCFSKPSASAFQAPLACLPPRRGRDVRGIRGTPGLTCLPLDRPSRHRRDCALRGTAPFGSHNAPEINNTTNKTIEKFTRFLRGFAHGPRTVRLE
jgi:hypothetical protein